MKFLTKVWQVSQKVGQLVGLFAQPIQQVSPAAGVIVGRVLDTSEKFTSIIKQVEISGQALSVPGPSKLLMAAPNIEQAILESAAIAGRKIANPTLFKQGATKIADGWADVLNSLHEDEAEKV